MQPGQKFPCLRAFGAFAARWLVDSCGLVDMFSSASSKALPKSEADWARRVG